MLQTPDFLLCYINLFLTASVDLLEYTVNFHRHGKLHLVVLLTNNPFDRSLHPVRERWTAFGMCPFICTNNSGIKPFVM